MIRKRSTKIKSLPKKELSQLISKINTQRDNNLKRVNVSKYPLTIINIIIYLIILIYILRLDPKTCLCATNWKKEFIKYYTIYALIKTVILCVYYKEFLQNIKSSQLIVVFVILDMLLLVSFITILLTYIKELKKKEYCECSRNWKREFMWIIGWILVGTLGITTLEKIVINPVLINMWKIPMLK